MTTNAIDRATRELDDLAGDPNLGQCDAVVDLFRGDLLLGIDDDKAAALVRRALGGELSPADRCYAQAILSTNSPQALANCRQAIEHDPFHQSARQMMIILLVALGRIEEANIHLVESEAMFPKSEAFLLARMVVEILRNRNQEAIRRLNQLDERLKVRYFPVIHALIQLYKPQRYVDGTYLGSGSLADLPRTAALWSSYFRRQPSPDVELSHNTVPPIRVPPFLKERGWEFAKILVSNIGSSDQDDRVVEKLARFSELDQDGLSRWLYANALLSRAMKQYSSVGQADDLFVCLMKEARGAYLRAKDTPTNLPLRNPILDGLIMTEAMLAFPKQGKRDAEIGKQAVQHIRERLASGPICHPNLLGPFAKCAFKAGEVELARFLLTDCERLDRKHPTIIGLRARIEFDAGAFGPAAKAAEQALALDPDNAEIQQILRESRTRLHQPSIQSHP
jgi:tetratricopeptide (TPR) repeat protein